MASKITRSARGQPCQVRLPFICNGNAETVVLAHGNGSAYAKPLGGKAPDWQGAYACHACHDVYDRRRPIPADSGLVRVEVELAFAEGVMRTQRILEHKGLLKAA